MDSGAEKEFSITDLEVSTKGGKSVAGLADGLSGLNIDSGGFEVYEMDWRTKIHLQESGEGSKAAAGQIATKNVSLSSREY